MSNEVPYPEFDTVFRLMHRVRVAFDQQAVKSKLTWTGLQVLTLIVASQDSHQHTTRASLAAALDITPGTVSVLVAGLVKNGLVTEAKNSKFFDGRRKQLRVTPNGRKAYYRGLVIREDVAGKARPQATQWNMIWQSPTSTPSSHPLRPGPANLPSYTRGYTWDACIGWL